MPDESHLPKVLVVTQNTGHLAFFEATLSPYFHLSVFQEVEPAMEQCRNVSSQIIIIDLNQKDDDNRDHFIEVSRSLKTKGPGLIATGGPELIDDIRRSGLDIPNQYVRWPIPAKTILDTISQIIGEKAEQSWRELPEQVGRPLTLTVDQYKDISKAIANGDPIDCASTQESCKPLIQAVSSGNHHSILGAVQNHHNYTYVHSLRVATLLTLFGHGLGMKGDDMLVLSAGGLMHDVGKLVTPKKILDKPGKLTDDEWPIMQNHVVKSRQILEESPGITKGALIIAGQHHEKIDGSGYPDGLKGAELNELARMSAIVDIFGALTDARSYKPAFPPEKAFGILEGMKEQIDQNLLNVFRAIFESGTNTPGDATI